MELQRPKQTLFRGTQSVLPRVVLLWIALTAVAGVFIGTIYRIELIGIRDMLWSGERQAMRLSSLAVSRELVQAGTDLLYFSEHTGLQDWLATRSPAFPSRFSEDYLSFNAHRPFYGPLRLLDGQGNELLRAGRDAVLPQREGQDRSVAGSAGSDARETLDLKRGALRILPYDPSPAAQAGTRVLSPALRLFTPVHDRQGARRGVLSLDYSGQRLLDVISAISREYVDKVWLVNTDQRWILGPDDAALDGIQRFPPLQKGIARTLIVGGVEQGQFMQDGALYTYAKLAPAGIGNDAFVPGAWVLLARESPALITGHVQRLRRNMLTIFGLTALTLVGVVGITAYHVIRRLQAEQSVRDSATMLRGLLESAPDAIVVTDGGGRIMLVNAEAKSLFGYTRAEMEGGSIGMLIPERFRERYLANLSSFIEETDLRPPKAGFDVLGLHKEGSEFPVSVSLNAVRTERGPLVIADIRDVTAKRRDERAIRDLNISLKQRNAELENVNRELESFSYSVSHDLCAPLRSIDGFSSILVNDYADRLDDKGRDRLERIRAASEHMRMLVDDMLKLAMVSRAELKHAAVDLSVMAREVGEDLHRQYPQRKVQFYAHPGVVVNGDARLLRIVLFNLLENSWKFTTKLPESRIEFGSLPHHGETTCFVHDNGAGFDMALSEKLFGAFQRLHTQDDFPGTGVGLATVQRIIHRHGGRIWAESGVGQGAWFYFTVNGGEVS